MHVCFFSFNLGWRDHIKHKAHAEILHNTEKHKKKNNRSNSQIKFVHFCSCLDIYYYMCQVH